MEAKRKRRLKDNSRNISCSFRTTESVIKDLEEISLENDRTKSLQCEHFVKESIKSYKKEKEKSA